jgi:hypothetical protein
MFILYYIPRHAFQDERIVLGIFTSEKKLLDSFSEWNDEQVYQENRLGLKSDGFILHNLDIEKDFDSDDSYVYEKIDINKIHV